MVDVENGQGETLAAHRALADTSRVAILEVLRRAQEPLDVAQLTERVGLHRNTVRSHLAVLQRAGLVGGEVGKREGPGRPRVVYRPLERLAGANGFRLLAFILAGYLAQSTPHPEEAALEAGRAWGQYLVDRPAPFAKLSREESLQRIQQLFQRLDFDPELEAAGEQVRLNLHHCPFRELATTHPEITCSVHLGLIRGALGEMRAPIKAGRLDSFVAPSLCVAHLAPSGSKAR